MKLKEIFSPENVAENLQARDRDGVLAELLEAAPRLKVSKKNLLKVLIEREEQSATAMNGMVAVPHGRIEGLDRFFLIVGRSRLGIPFGAEDGPTKIFFLLLAPEADTVNHLKILARIARILRRREFREELVKAASAHDLHTLIIKEEETAV